MIEELKMTKELTQIMRRTVRASANNALEAAAGHIRELAKFSGTAKMTPQEAFEECAKAVESLKLSLDAT